MKPIVFVLAIASTLVGCVASEVQVQPNSIAVQVGTNPPGENFVQLGAISAKHGGGCGLYGAQGNFEGAMNILQNKAAKRNADYVQILREQGEHMTGICLDRAYVIDGIAYKKMALAEKAPE